MRKKKKGFQPSPAGVKSNMDVQVVPPSGKRDKRDANEWPAGGGNPVSTGFKRRLLDSVKRAFRRT